MADAFIYDHVRTPRGRGKADGSLHGTTPIQLASQVLQAGAIATKSTQRSSTTWFSACRAPRRAGRQHRARGGTGRRLRRDRAGPATQSFLRLGARGGEQCRCRRSCRASRSRDRRRRRIDVTRADGQRCGAWAADPAVAYEHEFRAARYRRRPDRHAGRLFAHGRRQLRGRKPARAAAAWAEGRFSKPVVPVKDILGRVVLDRDEPCARRRPCRAAALKPSFAGLGEQGGFDAIAQMRYPRGRGRSTTYTPPANRAASSTVRPRSGRQQATSARRLAQAARPHPRIHVGSARSRRSC